MKHLAINAAMAALLALGSASFSPVGASAEDLQLEIGRDGPKLRLRQACDPDQEDCGPQRDGFRDDRDGDFRRDGRRSDRDGPRFCTDERALDKAERMGIRRARIDGSDRRSIDIRGRDRRGDRIEISFGRAPNCPVIG